jgi:hypothetical protein
MSATLYVYDPEDMYVVAEITAPDSTTAEQYAAENYDLDNAYAAGYGEPTVDGSCGTMRANLDADIVVLGEEA